MAPRCRREFLQLMLTGVAAVGAAPFDVVQGGRVFAQSPRQATVTTTPLNDHLHLLSGAGGNALLVSSGEGLVLVNGGSPERSDEVLKAVVAQGGGKRMTTLFNTDWCADHTGSNESVGAIGAEIIAHENTKQYLANDQFVEWQKRTYPAKPKRALPTKTFYTKGSIMAGTERLDYGHLGQAHTDGDIYMHLPGSNVLMTGHVMTVGKYPIADYTTGGWLGGILAATKTLLDLSNAETRVIPGTGPVQTRADLQAQFDMLTTLRERFAKMMRQGMSANDMLAAGATKEFDEKWGDPKLFVAVSYRGLWLHVRELGGIV
jgi:glyoxylase-like metal-dependent hydrolase (beta-lactamase superfamily II)